MNQLVKQILDDRCQSFIMEPRHRAVIRFVLKRLRRPLRLKLVCVLQNGFVAGNVDDVRRVRVGNGAEPYRKSRNPSSDCGKDVMRLYFRSKRSMIKCCSRVTKYQNYRIKRCVKLANKLMGMFITFPIHKLAP